MTTQWAAWTSALQLLVSTIGIVLVIASLRQAQKGLRAALSGLRISSRANAIQKDMGQKQTRAYVNVEDFVFRDGGPGELFVDVTLANKGSSPALNFQADCALHILAGNSSEGAPVGFDRANVVPRTFATGATLTISSGLGGQQHSMQEILAGDWTLVVFGIANYCDVFGEPHVTRFRWHWRGRYRANGRPMEPTEIGNEMT